VSLRSQQQRLVARTSLRHLVEPVSKVLVERWCLVMLQDMSDRAG